MVSVFDEIQFETGNVLSHRIEREAVFGEAKYAAFVYGRKAAMTTKFALPLSGIVLDGAIAVAENSLKKVESAEFGEPNVISELIYENRGSR